MRVNKMPLRIRLMMSLGLILTVTPSLLKDLYQVSDFERGLMLGFGLGLEVTGLILMRRFRPQESGCRQI